MGLLISLLEVIASSVASAQRGVDTIESLRGLKGVYVAVENLGSDLEAAGLTKGIIQADVELKLRLARIKVLTEKEWLEELGNPSLYISVIGMKSEFGLYACSMVIELHQKVSLSRYPAIVVLGAITWHRGSIGVCREYKVDEIRDGVKDIVDKFINAYLSVNPK